MEAESDIINNVLGEENAEVDTASVILAEKPETSTLTRRKKTREQLARERRAKRLKEAEEAQNAEGNASESSSSDASETAAAPKKTKEQLARERRAQRLKNLGENRLDYVIGTRDTPEMTAEELAQKEAAEAARAARGQDGDPLDGMNNIIDKFDVIRNVYRILKRLAFVILVLYVLKSLQGYRLKYIDGWSLAIVEKYNPDDVNANIITSPQYLFPENIALYAVNEKGKEALMTTSLIKVVKRSDGSLLYIAAPVGDHTRTFSVTQREFKSKHFYGFVKVKMNPIIAFFVMQGITSLIKFLILS